MFGSASINPNTSSNPLLGGSQGASGAQPFSPSAGSRPDAAEQNNNSQQSSRNLGLKSDSDVAQFLAGQLLSSSNSKQATSPYDGPDSLVPQFLRDVTSQLGKFGQGNSANNFTDILNKAQKQITAAVNDLHAILKGASPELQDTANKLGAGLNDGLARLGEGLQAGEGEAIFNRTEVAYELDAKASFSITTQDGDTVELSFSTNNQVAAFSENESNGTSSSSSSGLYISSDSQVSVNISGDIDEGELEAIQSVISQVDDIAASFFDGDVEEALSNLGGFNIDQNELSSVGINLSRREHIAVSSYTEIAKLAPGYDQNSLSQDNPNTNTATSLAGSLEERLDSISTTISNHFGKQDEQFSFAADKDVTLDLLSSLINVRQNDQDGQLDSPDNKSKETA